MTKIFAASFTCEVNTFSQFPADEEAFFNGYYTTHGEHDFDNPHFIALPLVTAKKETEKLGWEYQESLCAAAAPAGVLTQQCYAHFKAIILQDLSNSSGLIDGVFLFLHGAMVAEECDDCEGDLLASIREVIGDAIPIAVVLDPHAHMTKKMQENATVMGFLKEYPHTDYQECAAQIFDILAKTIQGKIQPVMSLADCEMIGLYPTSLEPMKSYVAEMRMLESGNPNILNVSVIHGFPWGDVEDMGTKIIVTTNNKQELGDCLAQKLCKELSQIRGDVFPVYHSLDSALEYVHAQRGACPVILADFSDNTGMGAMGDSTFILERLVQENISHMALSPLYDPDSVRQCFDCGEGGKIKLLVGGKGDFSGEPLLLNVTVIKCRKDFKAPFGKGEGEYGDCVTIKLNGSEECYVVLCSKRLQTFSTQCFTDMGIRLTDMKVLVVKSAEHYRQAFSQVTGVEQMLTVTTPGLINLEFDKIPYKKSLLFVDSGQHRQLVK